MKEKHVPDKPKQVRSQSLSRGPFIVDGFIVGPLRLGQEGEVKMSSMRLYGTFELSSDSDVKSKHIINPKEYDKSKRPELAAWVSKEELTKTKNRTKEQRKLPNWDEIELDSQMPSHRRSVCQYCCYIPSMFNNSGKGFWQQAFEDSANNHNKSGNDETKSRKVPVYNTPTPPPNSMLYDQCSKRHICPERYDPKVYSVTNPEVTQSKYIRRQAYAQGSDSDDCESHQLVVEADVHRSDSPECAPPVHHSKCANLAQTDNALHTPQKSFPSPCKEPVLNLATAEDRQQCRARKSPDNYCLAKVPIVLKDFKGEVNTEIEIFRDKTTADQSNNSSPKPLFVVSTKVNIQNI